MNKNKKCCCCKCKDCKCNDKKCCKEQKK